MYAFFADNKLVSKHQSGFRPGDSTINQLLAVTDEIFQSFESNAETRAAFLDISKAFDKVWHEGLQFKLKQRISGKLHSLISDFLSERKQRVVLNGKESPWLPLNAGVPQGSILGPHKKKKPDHPPLFFNGIPVKRESHTQHTLGVILDQRLNFRIHIKEKIKKANRGLGLLKLLSRYTTRTQQDLQDTR